MGVTTNAAGMHSHAEGQNTTAAGNYSHTEGYNTETGGDSDANNKDAYDMARAGVFSHAEGNATIARGAWSHSEGALTFVRGIGSHAEGYGTTVEGNYSHAEGYKSTVGGIWSHVAGSRNIATGNSSILHGVFLNDGGNDNITVVGRCNDPQTNDIFEVGCGKYIYIDADDADERRNAISVNSNGETTIPNLNSTNANIKDLTSTNITLTTLTSKNANIENLYTKGVDIGTNGYTINESIADLPESDTKCRSFICKDGILVGYTEENFMYLTIETDGKIYLRRRGKDVDGYIHMYELELTNDKFNWIRLTE